EKLPILCAVKATLTSQVAPASRTNVAPDTRLNGEPLGNAAVPFNWAWPVFRIVIVCSTEAPMATFPKSRGEGFTARRGVVLSGRNSCAAGCATRQSPSILAKSARPSGSGVMLTLNQPVLIEVLAGIHTAVVGSNRAVPNAA